MRSTHMVLKSPCRNTVQKQLFMRPASIPSTCDFRPLLYIFRDTYFSMPITQLIVYEQHNLYITTHLPSQGIIGGALVVCDNHPSRRITIGKLAFLFTQDRSHNTSYTLRPNFPSPRVKKYTVTSPNTVGSIPHPGSTAMN